MTEMKDSEPGEFFGLTHFTETWTSFDCTFTPFFCSDRDNAYEPFCTVLNRSSSAQTFDIESFQRVLVRSTLKVFVSSFANLRVYFRYATDDDALFESLRVDDVELSGRAVCNAHRAPVTITHSFNFSVN